MQTLSTEQLLTWIRWYRRHCRTALARLPEDVPGTRADPEPLADKAPDAGTSAAPPRTRRCSQT